MTIICGLNRTFYGIETEEQYRKNDLLELS